MEFPKLRKKLTMTIVTLIVNWLVVLLANYGIDLDPAQQLKLVEGGMVASAIIIGFFNYGQGLADKGKEAGKVLLVLMMASALLLSPIMVYIPYAQSEPAPTEEPATAACEHIEGELGACIELLDDCTGCEECEECPVVECPAVECPKVDCSAIKCDESIWKTIIKDRTLQATLIGSAILLIGGIAGIFMGPPG